MAYTLQNQGALDQALESVEEARNIQKETCGPTSKEFAASANLMGFIQSRRGKLVSAIDLLQEAYQIRISLRDLIKASESLMNMGNVYRTKKECEKALESYNECLMIRRAELGDGHEKVASVLVGIANVKYDQDRYEEARLDYEDALAIREECLGAKDNRVADVVKKLADIDFERSQYGMAVERLTQVVQIREANRTRNAEYMDTLVMLGNLYKQLGNEEEAKRCLSKAYETFQDLGLAGKKPLVEAALRKAAGRRRSRCEKLACSLQEVKKETQAVTSAAPQKKRQGGSRWAKKAKKIIFTI